jgi:hypothetical protein
MKINVTTLALFLVTLLLSSCQAIGDIFKTGVGVGVVGVVVVIIIIIFFVTRGKK